MALTKITGDGYGAGTITTADNTAQLTLKSTDADASVGPVLKLQRDSSSPAASDIIGQILFHGEDDGGNDQEYARITTSIRNPAHLSEASNFTIETQKAGDKVSRLKMNENEAVFNEDSKDIDFRVESDGNANMLFVDGGNNAVGIGSAPNTTFGSLLYAQGTPAANKPIISGYSQGNSNNAGFALLNDSGNRGIWTTGSNMRFTRTYEGNSNTDMTINSSGTLGIGKTPDSSLATVGTEIHQDGTVLMSRNSSPTLFINRSDDGTVIQIFRGASTVGTISVTSSNTAYNTSSDYRLKENVDYTWDATTRLKQLKPARFNFIADDTNTLVDGFIAHEVSGIVPEAITGEKDAVETWTSDEVDNGDAPDGVSAGANKLDADGNTIPVMQGIDQSKLVPLLVKTIQELEARITALESA